MKALIDLDPLVYNYAGILNQDGELLPKSVHERLLVAKIEKILEAVIATEWEGFLTYGPDNFRIGLASIRPYKGNRKGREKPPLHDHIRSFLTDLPEVTMVFGQEADDALSIAQWSDYKSASDTVECSTIICSPDKDLDMVPGWHYRWGTGGFNEIQPWFQTEEAGLRSFYKQCLTGDTTDNIPGLYGIGKGSKHLSVLDELVDELDMVEHVLSLYRKWYGSYAEKFLTEVGSLLWMRSYHNEYWSIPK